MADINVLREPETGREIYGENDRAKAFRCTNAKGRVVDVTPMHFERFRKRDGLEKVGSSDNFITLVGLKGIEIKSTERWAKNNDLERFGYRKKKAGK